MIYYLSYTQKQAKHFFNLTWSEKKFIPEWLDALGLTGLIKKSPVLKKGDKTPRSHGKVYPICGVAVIHTDFRSHRPFDAFDDFEVKTKLSRCILYFK